MGTWVYGCVEKGMIREPQDLHARLLFAAAFLAFPPGEYIYTASVSLSDFLELVARIRGPENGWPV